jgi:protein MYSM1
MTNSISKAQEEEMSSALIAKILAEDAMVQGNDDYYVEYSNQRHRYEADDDYDEEDNSGDDFNPKKKEKPGVKKTGNNRPSFNISLRLNNLFSSCY